MTGQDYVQNALRTESPVTPELVERMVGQARVIHALFGINTELGELTDPYKKHIFYGKSLDGVNVREEVGDLLWYVAILLDVLGDSFEEVMRINIEKLRARFPQKFAEDKALVRDLDTERAVLEQEPPRPSDPNTKGSIRAEHWTAAKDAKENAYLYKGPGWYAIRVGTGPYGKDNVCGPYATQKLALDKTV